jgi:hypothetical protein
MQTNVSLDVATEADRIRATSQTRRNSSESPDQDNASPSRRIYRRSRGPSPWEVSFPKVADKLDNFCATYSYLSFLYRYGPFSKISLGGRNSSVCFNRNKKRPVSFGIDRFILGTLVWPGMFVHQGLLFEVRSSQERKSRQIARMELFLARPEVSGHISPKVGERMAT